MVSCVQLHLMKGAEAGGPVVDPGGERGLEGTLARAIILCVCTVSASVEVRSFEVYVSCVVCRTVVVERAQSFFVLFSFWLRDSSQTEPWHGRRSRTPGS